MPKAGISGGVQAVLAFVKPNTYLLNQSEKGWNKR